MFTVYYRSNDAIEKDPLCIQPKVGGLDKADYAPVITLNVSSAEDVFRVLNNIGGNDLPVGLFIRSMMTGDVVEGADGKLWYCSVMGWSVTNWK